MAPVGGVLLWKEPWVSRFKEAGEHAAFQAVQQRMAETGEHMQLAEKAARAMKIYSLRGVTLAFDRSVNTGPYRVKAIAEDLAKTYSDAQIDPPYEKRLLDFQRRFAERFEKDRPLGSSWRQVGNVWRKFLGNTDLYELTMRRTDAVLRSDALSDALIPNFPA